jgi:uncharacterized membrane protein YphA (DoxX/SURF4 family)
MSATAENPRDHAKSAGLRHIRPGWAMRRIGVIPWLMLAVCCICVAATILTTWPLWQDRVHPPNVPLLPWLGGISFGVPLLGSLLIQLWAPRMGTYLFCLVLAAAMACDLIRCQPQMFALPVLMVACVWPGFRVVGRWFLVAMWLWAGLHKLLSPDWMGPSSWSLLDRMGWEAALDWYQPFAWSVAIGEIVLAVVAVAKPRWAAIPAAALHLGIVVMLLDMGWNFSVLYWNIANAFVGAWLLWTCPDDRTASARPIAAWPAERWQQAVTVILLVTPAGVYNGWVPHFLAHVLYSDNMPKAMMTTLDGPEEMDTWDTLHAPLPRVPAILRGYFQRIARPGEKLHLYETRPGMQHQQYWMPDSGGPVLAITEEEFRQDSGVGPGISKDYPPAVFYLQEAGVRLLKRTERGMIYALQFQPQGYSPETFRHVAGLLNLEQIQLADCPVTDDDLRYVNGLRMLYGIGVENTQLTDGCLPHLSSLPRLRIIEYAGSQLTAEAVQNLLDRSPKSSFGQ